MLGCWRVIPTFAATREYRSGFCCRAEDQQTQIQTQSQTQSNGLKTKKKVLVVGSGWAGLGAAHHLCKQAIQHAHSFSMQSFENRQRLVDMKREASSMKREIRALEAKMKKLEDQAEAATKVQTLALEKAEAAEAVKKVAEAEKREAEAGRTQAEKELQQALATKEAEIKEADEKAYAQGMADVAEDYKFQVRQACNRGFSLGWTALIKKLDLPADSPLRQADAIPLPFPPPPPEGESESDADAVDEDEEKDEGEALVRKPRDAADAQES